MSISFRQNTQGVQAKSNVFNTPELLEMILLALPEKNIMADAARTCRGFKDAIESSVQLKRKIWRLPKTDSKDPRIAMPVGKITTDYVRMVPARRNRDFYKIIEGGVQRPEILNSLVFKTSGGLVRYIFGSGSLMYGFGTAEQPNEAPKEDLPSLSRCFVINTFHVERPVQLSSEQEASLAAMQMFDPPATKVHVSYHCVPLAELENKDGVKVSEFFKSVRTADPEVWTSDDWWHNGLITVSTTRTVFGRFPEDLEDSEDVSYTEAIVYSD